jgi:hypothetical protein
MANQLLSCAQMHGKHMTRRLLLRLFPFCRESTVTYNKSLFDVQFIVERRSLCKGKNKKTALPCVFTVFAVLCPAVSVMSLHSCIWPIDPYVVLSRGEICGLIRTTIIWFNNVCIGCLELSDSAGSLVRREKPNDVKFTRERRERSLRSIFDRWPLPKCTQTCGPCGQEQERKTPNT